MQPSFIGPPIDDNEMLASVPVEVADAWRIRNGFISSSGAFHHRGACAVPLWHSIRVAWMGELALFNLFPSVLASDIPLAQDCFGDQYLLRKEKVIHLSGETGEIEHMEVSWSEFLERVDANPTEFLQLKHLERFKFEGGTLLPGQLLSVYPPFVAAAECERSLKPVPALELINWLADFSRQIARHPDGTKIKITATHSK